MAQTQNHQNSIHGIKHVIAVSSGKGGVGKSTVSVNLAVSLSKLGYKVGLLDADIYGPNIPTMMGVTEEPKIEATESGEMFLPPTAHGIKVMSMGFLLEDDQPVVWRGPMLHNMLTQFCHRVKWGELDFLIMDLPPGTGDVQLSLSQLVSISGAVVVTTPQEVSAQDVRKAMHMFSKVRVPVLGIIENMSFFRGDDGKEYKIFGEGAGQRIADKFSVNLLEKLPLVIPVREGGDLGKPVTVSQPDSEISKHFRNAAARMIDVLEEEMKKGTIVSEPVQIGKF